MKKILITILAFSFLFFACNGDSIPEVSIEESQKAAENLIIDSPEYIENQGFDITLLDTNIQVRECSSCYEFDYTFGVIGDKIGYNMKVQVKNGKAAFTEGPTVIGNG